MSFAMLTALWLIIPPSLRERAVERSGTFGILRGGICCAEEWYGGYFIDVFRQGIKQ
jgi:hypothetical protein